MQRQSEEEAKSKCQEKIKFLLEENSRLSNELNEITKEITSLNTKETKDHQEFIKEKSKLEKQIEIMKTLDNYEKHSNQLQNLLQSISKRQQFFDEAIPSNEVNESRKSKKRISAYTEAFNMNSNLLNKFS